MGSLIWYAEQESIEVAILNSQPCQNNAMALVFSREK
jgi:hypothetical protein